MIRSLVITAIWVALGLTGDSFFKRAATSPKFLAVGALTYLCCSIPAAFMFRRSDFMTVAYQWDALSLIGTALVAVVYFREPLTARKLAAILLLAFAVWLLNEKVGAA